ncbi:MAG TPA: alpha/beta fold hydrolase [Thermoanaerobaculia bacterium]|nr:alpha/beta fold hydrolase [Thermoanaerobaculia bacterium]
MTHEKVELVGSLGARLAGRLDTPEGAPAGYALFAHCFTCGKDLKAAGGICRELLARGIAVLRFDFTGLGESEGEFADTNFSSNVGDLVAAADFLRRERQAPALLVGHSLGGTAMLAAAASIPEAAAVATLGAPSDTRLLRAKLAARLPLPPNDPNDPNDPNEPHEPNEEAAYEVDLGGTRPVRIRRQLLEDLAGDHLRGVLAALGRALLIFHSPVDRTVGIEHAERLFLAARHPKSFVSLGTADHLLSDPRDAAHAGAVLAAWAGRYMPAGAAAPQLPMSTGIPALPATASLPAGERAVVVGTGIPAIPADHAPAAAPAARALAAGEVEVSGTAHSLRQEVVAGGHHLVADEPAADGGTDAGPTPYGLLLAALGACSGITMRLYADRKGLPLAGTRVRLRHSRDHKADCEGCAEGGTRLERIDRELELLGPLTAEQRARLAAIAERCPVHRTLGSGVQIVTKLR